MNKEAISQGGNTPKKTGWEGFAAKSSDNEKLRTIYDQKSAKAILYGPKAFFERSAKVSEQEKSLALDRIIDGEFTLQNESEALKTIASNLQLEGAKIVQDRIEKDKAGKWLLDNVTTTQDQTNKKQSKVERLLEQYPTPIEFEQREKAVIAHIEKHSPTLLSEYKSAINNLKKDVYGKRLDYHESFARLRSEAKLKEHVDTERESAKKELEKNRKIGKITIKTALEKQMPTLERAVKFHKLNEKEKEKILDSSYLAGDPVTYLGKSYKIDKTFYKNNDLAPEYTIKYGNKEISFSKIFTQSGRPSVIGYVPGKKGTKMVSFYRSKSQGEWRLLPEYVSDPNNKKTMSSYFCKGYTENSLNLGEAFAAYLDRAVSEPHSKTIKLQAEMAFLATAKKYNTKEEYGKAIHSGTRKGDYYNEVSERPMIEIFQREGAMTPPSKLDLSGPFSPNFEKRITTRTTETSHYGEVSIDTYLSENGELLYKFCRNQEGKAWLADVEVEKSDLSSDGIKKKWVDFGDLTTPAHEYKDQVEEKYATDYGNKVYTSTWEKYLSKSPLINRYLASKKA